MAHPVITEHYIQEVFMGASRRQGAKRDTLNLSITPHVRRLVDRAAELMGKNRTDFVLDTARHAAEDEFRPLGSFW